MYCFWKTKLDPIMISRLTAVQDIAIGYPCNGRNLPHCKCHPDICTKGPTRWWCWWFNDYYNEAQNEAGFQGFQCTNKYSSIFVQCPSSSALTPFSWWWSACGGTNAEPLVSCQPVAPSRARLGLVYTALVVFRAIFGIEASIRRYN